MTRKNLKGREQGTGNREQRIAAVAALAMLFLVTGCRQDMQNQPKLIPQRGSEMFADHRGARPQVLNTVARGQLREDSYFYTGVVQGPTAIARSRT